MQMSQHIRELWAFVRKEAGASAPNYTTELPDEAAEDADAARQAKGPLGLGASVGKGGKNEPDDVLAVQKALNKKLGAGVPESGKCDGKTQSAIEEFQKRLGQF